MRVLDEVANLEFRTGPAGRELRKAIRHLRISSWAIVTHCSGRLPPVSGPVAAKITASVPMPSASSVNNAVQSDRREAPRRPHSGQDHSQQQYRCQDDEWAWTKEFLHTKEMRNP